MISVKATHAWKSCATRRYV